MSPNAPSSPSPLSSASGPPPSAKKRHWLLYGCAASVVVLLVIVATVAITLWWIQRPIKPVVLSPQEKATVEEKLRLLRGNAPTTTAGHVAPVSPSPTIPDRPYTPGSKALKLTEREINGLLNANTELGHSVRLEFARDAINAYVAVPIPKDFPIGGGKMFRARGRFRLSIGNGGEPYAVLEDVTVFGLSLPKSWLGGLKGENLLAEATRENNGAPILKGVKSLRVEPGALVLEVED
jgi:hypothetical protein